MRKAFVLAIALSTFMAAAATADLAQWPQPVSPVIAQADGFVVIPKAAIPPDKARTYRVVWNATQAADKPDQLLPALNMAGSELNAFGAAGVPGKNVKFVVVFHGNALDGILDDAHYKAKFGVPNPNLKVLAEMKKAGVKLYVCGQNLWFAKVEPEWISSDVTVASDALIVLMTYQNDGYALMEF